MSSFTKYLVEPRDAEGKLDAKRVGTEAFRNRMPKDGEFTEDQLFDVYFAYHREKTHASWGELREWFEAFDGGYRIREKNW